MSLFMINRHSPSSHLASLLAEHKGGTDDVTITRKYIIAYTEYVMWYLLQILASKSTVKTAIVTLQLLPFLHIIP